MWLGRNTPEVDEGEKPLFKMNLDLELFEAPSLHGVDGLERKGEKK